tara:strand:- start:1788 stop:2285 length:498 start_codon:yes stop_codon:yes gene_type:complete
MKQKLVAYLIATQIALWISYFLFFKQKNVNFKSLWGDTPKSFQSWLLLAATVAYVLNLLLIISMAISSNLTDDEEWILIACILFYYVAQLLFLPLTKLAVDGKIPKFAVTALLLVCVIPLAIIAGVVTKHVTKQGSKAVMFKLTTAYAPLLHVLINDAVLFGFLF